jgi:hypothetical protein
MPKASVAAPPRKEGRPGQGPAARLRERAFLTLGPEDIDSYPRHSKLYPRLVRRPPPNA